MARPIIIPNGFESLREFDDYNYCIRKLVPGDIVYGYFTEGFDAKPSRIKTHRTISLRVIGTHRRHRDRFEFLVGMNDGTDPRGYNPFGFWPLIGNYTSGDYGRVYSGLAEYTHAWSVRTTTDIRIASIVRD